MPFKNGNAVNHPAHYNNGCTTGTRDIVLTMLRGTDFTKAMFEDECIEVIEALNLGFHSGNALKYLWRAGLKGSLLEDLGKAKWYLIRHVIWSYDSKPRFVRIFLKKPRGYLQAIEDIDNFMEQRYGLEAL